MSTSLAEIQAALAAHVLGEEPSELRAFAHVPVGADVSARLAVYAGGYGARVYEALAEAYPATVVILGSNSFGALVDRALPSQPRGWCNLNDVGRDWPEFVKTDSLTLGLPFLPDLVQLEQHVHHAFHAEMPACIDLSRAATWDLERWASSHFTLRPDLAWLDSAWPIRDLWGARLMDRTEIDIELVGRPQAVRVEREGFGVVVSEVDRAEIVLAKHLLDGASFGEALGAIAAEGVDGEWTRQLIARWIGADLIAAVD